MQNSYLTKREYIIKLQTIVFYKKLIILFKYTDF